MCRVVDESVPSQQGLKHDDFGRRPIAGAAVDESVPSQQGLKQNAREVVLAAVRWSMSPFHHNKD